MRTKDYVLPAGDNAACQIFSPGEIEKQIHFTGQALTGEYILSFHRQKQHFKPILSGFFNSKLNTQNSTLLLKLGLPREMNLLFYFTGVRPRSIYEEIKILFEFMELKG